MKFIDHAKIYVQAGNGGSGCASFRREKFVPKGGPSGGDGGRGGDVVLIGDAHMTTLLDYRFKREYKAKSGFPGQGSKRFGKDGQTITLKVPLGTLIKDAKNDEIICDIVSDGQEVLLACGGKGGRGNVHFKTSVNQAPRRYDEGERGEVFDLVLELKLLADVGLVGCPNAGKSTLVSRFSAAKPKIANYPFTTLKPVLGVVQCALGESYVMADIPGLIEGAHEGTGLGDEFLRHVERTRVLVFVLDLSGYENDPRSDYAMLCNEIESYDSRIAQKKKIIALNKCDLPYNEEIVDHFKTEGLEVFLISGVTGEGCQQLHNCIWETLNSREEE